MGFDRFVTRSFESHDEAYDLKCYSKSKATKSSGGVFSSLTGLFSRKSKAMPESCIVESTMEKSIKSSKKDYYGSKDMKRVAHTMKMC